MTPTAVAKTLFSRAWSAVRHDSPLAALAVPDYWHQEITHVIKGRGITTFDQYAELPRIGRRTPLSAAHRPRSGGSTRSTSGSGRPPACSTGPTCCSGPETWSARVRRPDGTTR